MTESDANQKLLTIHRRRLAKLKERAALFGAIYQTIAQNKEQV